jgi:GntR family transcriptional regulator
MSADRPYSRIAGDLRAEILSGQLPAGSKLPTRAELRDRYGVANATINSALDLLRAEGLIYGTPGGRVLVRQRTVLRLARNRLARSEREAGRGFFLTDAEAGGWQPQSDVTVSVEPAAADIAEELHIAAGAPVLVRDRVMSAGGELVQLATSYLPRDLTEGTPIEDDNPGPGGIIGRLEDAGYPPALFREHVRVVPATEEDAGRLEVPVAATLWLITRTTFGADRPLEVNRIRILAARAELVYELAAE